MSYETYRSFAKAIRPILGVYDKRRIDRALLDLDGDAPDLGVELIGRIATELGSALGPVASERATLAPPPSVTVVQIPDWANHPGNEWRLVPRGSLDAVMALDPADHATKSRDYGRGFADALRRVHELLTPKANYGGDHD